MEEAGRATADGTASPYRLALANGVSGEPPPLTMHCSWAGLLPARSSPPRPAPSQRPAGDAAHCAGACTSAAGRPGASSLLASDAPAPQSCWTCIARQYCRSSNTCCTTRRRRCSRCGSSCQSLRCARRAPRFLSFARGSSRPPRPPARRFTAASALHQARALCSSRPAYTRWPQVLLPEVHAVVSQAEAQHLPVSAVMHLLSARARSGAPMVQSCMLRLLWHCQRVLCKQLEAWLVHGLLLDCSGEFFIRRQGPEAAAGSAEGATAAAGASGPAAPAKQAAWQPSEWHVGFEVSPPGRRRSRRHGSPPSGTSGSR